MEAEGGLVGRSGERKRVRELLGRSRVVTITGFPGVGKSVLARDVAGSLADAFPDGVWVVPLGEIADPGLVTHAIGLALGLPDRFDRSALDVLGQWLQGRRCLVVLDECEHLTGACAKVVEELASRCPGLRIIATSRRPLGWSGEYVLKLLPLSETNAMKLLLARAREVDPGLRIGRAEAVGLCRKLDALPLAIELAASRLGSETVAQVAHGLDVQALRCLDSGGTGRHDSLVRTLGWSHQIGTPAQRLLWARLSVFSEEFDTADAEFVCTGRALAAEAVWETLPELAESSLLGIARGQYWMPRLVRAYGEHMLWLLGEDVEARHRYERWKRER
ncbi:ATP-binding protein [Actinomadura rupiterrae]|uniref:ATP-binding protein n=1 Tax=Actinomadura rupiterrae TaxID=559627 RepID=UPI0020A2AECD|nr:AAA family ATPase [Actinomadura rupiterrae]MCP2343000.1 putative ATPase [Actinomadura rupiterrae]